MAEVLHLDVFFSGPHRNFVSCQKAISVTFCEMKEPKGERNCRGGPPLALGPRSLRRASLLTRISSTETNANLSCGQEPQTVNMSPNVSPQVYSCLSVWSWMDLASIAGLSGKSHTSGAALNSGIRGQALGLGESICND